VRDPYFQSLLLASLLATFGPAVANEPNISFYEVSGSSASKLREHLNEIRPADAHGERFDSVTNYQLSYTYRVLPESKACKFTKFNPTIEVTITLPKWLDADPDSRLGRRWQSYYNALYSHEMGHYDLAIRTFDKLKQIGSGFKTSNGCNAIGAEFKTLFDETLHELERSNADYDLQTDHGRKQGAIFP
jgi:predicted secreted Zn-dependent protease